MSVFISTGAFLSRDIRDILEIADRYDIRYIELSPGLDYVEEITEIISEAAGRFHFLIHNYFPPQKDTFALNLASADPLVQRRSIDMCKENIDLAARWGMTHYSVHCGYCFDTDGRALGSSSQVELPYVPYEEALHRFTDNVRTLCDYAATRSIRLAIENNVVAEFARDYRDRYLGVAGQELLDIVREVDRDNLRILLDLAHARVSCHCLGMELADMVWALRDQVAEWHISENDGRRDQNLPLTEQSEMLPYLKGCGDTPVTIEVYHLTPQEILEQIAITEARIHADR